MKTKEIIALTKKLHLLYVEDDKDMRTTSMDLFESFFAQVTTANDGLEALQKYEKGLFDIIISDISMPRMDGIEFIKKIREVDHHIPVIVYSAWNDPAHMTSCMALNVDGYLLKPIQTENIMEVLEKASLKLLGMKNSELSKDELDEKERMHDKRFTIDRLTGLKSHNLLLQEIEESSDLNIPVMILINIDEFHIYNELYGLGTGDEILVKFAHLLEVFCANSSYDLYRMSGDEFVLFEEVQVLDTEKYEEEMKRLFAFIDDSPIIIDGIEEPILLAITAGISFDKDNSYGKANMAMTEARKRGRKHLGFNAEADRTRELQNNLYWRKEINSALSEKRVHAYYQPIVDKMKNIIQYEALMRIEQVKEGKSEVVSPYDFLDLAKMSRQYIALTTVIINESFDTMIKHNVHVAINLTFHDIENREINRLLRDRIAGHHLANKTKFDISSQVIFELVENRNAKDYVRFTDFIKEFKGLGVLITIDNFGLGSSNMSKIAAIAPNYVKIDSTLMKNLDTDRHAYSLVKAIVRFTKELGIKTIAEHVTSEAIFEKSLELGIEEFQGYYFGEPVRSIDADEG